MTGHPQCPYPYHCDLCLHRSTGFEWGDAEDSSETGPPITLAELMGKGDQ